jgi:hypothetical protein
MACPHHRDDILDGAWQNHADWNLSVIRRLRGICGSGAGVEPYLRVRGLSELALQREKLVEVEALRRRVRFHLVANYGKGDGIVLRYA